MIRHWFAPLVTGLLLGAIAWQITVVAFPDVLMSFAIKRVSKAGFNVMRHAPTPTAKERAIVRPNPDLAFSYCPYDVAKGPVLIDAVPVTGPYWSLSIFDSHTDTVFVRNSGQAQGKPFRIAIAHAGQATPAGYEAVRVDGDRGIALVRILVADRATFPAIDRERRETACRAG